MTRSPARLPWLAALLAAMLLLPGAPAAQAAVPAAELHPFDLPPGFVQEVLARDLGPATAFALRPDGSILIARKHGSVKVWREGEVLDAPFIDLSGEVNIYADRGLMGIAVHPNYPNPAYVYLAYAYEPGDAAGHAESGARTARVLRVQASPANPDKARDGSRVVLLGKSGAPDYAGNLDRGDRPPYSCMAGEGGADSEPVADCLPVDGPSHTVDGLVFGPDGALYVSAGDGTLQPDLNVRAQNLDSLAGKVLRVDPLTGAGYADNPFYDGDPLSNRSKVYAFGLRNPYRFTFDPAAGELVVGDVGGERWEEINRGGAGSNWGWPCLEGPLPNSADAACAGVLGGSIPTLSAWHSYEHAGGYSAAIGGDFYTGDQFPAAYRGAYFFADHNRAALLYLPAGAQPPSSAQVFATSVIAPVQITQGPDGSLYVLSFVDGALSRIRYTGDGAAVAQAETQPSQEGEQADAEQTDTEQAENLPPAGESAPAGAAPVVTILAPADESAWPPGAEIDLVGEAADAEDGPLAGAALQWTATLHHNEHIHPDFHHATGERSRLLFEEHAPGVWLEVCLAATDSDGLMGNACVTLHLCEEGEPCATPPAPVSPAASVAGGARHEGGLWREMWLDVGGAAVDDLLALDRYPNAPDSRELLPALETSGAGKDYGERLHGYLLPPTSGAYNFWIAADDSAELWLSTDEDPANAQQVAAVESWTAQRQWDKHPGQASAPIRLEAGLRYYIEVRHKQADQKANLAVAWQPPGRERAVIGGDYLAPNAPDLP